jgi:hypothetical protein
MTRRLAAALVIALFPFVRLQIDHFLSQIHPSQALCELRGAYSGHGLVTRQCRA